MNSIGRTQKQFNPDRFLDKEVEKNYLPFGAGPRMCIGYGFAMMEMQLILTRIIQKFGASAFVYQQDIQMKPQITLRSDRDLVVSF